jgi:hypothetical protein
MKDIPRLRELGHAEEEIGVVRDVYNSGEGVCVRRDQVYSNVLAAVQASEYSSYWCLGVRPLSDCSWRFMMSYIRID